MKKRGFTLIEVIVVIALIAIVLTLAVPNIFKFRERANETALQKKIDNLATIVETYIENNSNDIVYKCQNHDAGCICNTFSGSNPNYTCNLKLQKLIDLMLYNEPCNAKSGTCTCKISNPNDETNCLENKTFSISFNLGNNVAHATLIE